MSKDISFSLSDLKNPESSPKIEETKDYSENEVNEQSQEDNSLSEEQFSEDLSNRSDSQDSDDYVENQQSENYTDESGEERPRKKKNRRPSLAERNALKLAEQERLRREQLEAEYLQTIEENSNLKKYAKAQTYYSSLKDWESIETAERELKSILEKAREEGDTDTEFEVNKHLNNLWNKKSQLQPPSSFDDSDDEDYQIPAQYFGPNYYQQPAPQIDENFQNFVQKNPWIQRPQLKERAVRVMEELDAKYALEGRENEIGTPKFYEEVSKIVRGSYNVNGRSPQQYAGPTVEGSSSGDSLVPQYESRGIAPWKDIRLTQQDIDIARRVNSGINPRTQKPFTPAEQIDSYKRSIYMSQKFGNGNDISFSLSDLKS